MLVFHCEGECSNVVLNVKGDFFAGLGMQLQFPAIWFKSPTLYRHIIYLRIANPEHRKPKALGLAYILTIPTLKNLKNSITMSCHVKNWRVAMWRND